MKKLLLAIISGCMLVTSCKTIKPSKNTTNETVVFNEVNYDPIFKGLGTEPFWNLSFNDEFVVYEDVNQQKIILPITSNQKAQDANVKLIKATKDDVSIDITIIHQKCSDGMSDTEYDYKINVDINQTNKKESLSGCGSYIIPLKLQAKWELSYFLDADIPSNKFLKTPYIEFNDNNLNFSGNASCNGIKGMVFFDDEVIRFNKVASTKMMCVHDNMEKEFLNELPKITKYKLVNNELHLYTDTELKMKFVKKQKSD